MKTKRKVWWSDVAQSPKALKKWFADRGRDIKPIQEVIWSRHEETMPEFIQRLERIAEQRAKNKQRKESKK